MIWPLRRYQIPQRLVVLRLSISSSALDLACALMATKRGLTSPSRKRAVSKRERSCAMPWSVKINVLVVGNPADAELWSRVLDLQLGSFQDDSPSRRPASSLRNLSVWGLWIRAVRGKVGDDVLLWEAPGPFSESLADGKDAVQFSGWRSSASDRSLLEKGDPYSAGSFLFTDTTDGRSVLEEPLHSTKSARERNSPIRFV